MTQFAEVNTEQTPNRAAGNNQGFKIFKVARHFGCEDDIQVNQHRLCSEEGSLADAARIHNMAMLDCFADALCQSQATSQKLLQ